VLRLTLLGALGLALAGPSLAWTAHPARRFVVAVDRSAAVGEAARREATERVAAFVALAQTEGARTTALGFGDTASVPFDPSAPDAAGWPSRPPDAAGSLAEPGRTAH